MFNNIISRIINRKSQNPLTKEEQKLLIQIKDYTLLESTFNYYIRNVKYNEITTYEDTRRKLIRNVILSREGFRNNRRPTRRVFYYGNLLLLLDEEEKAIVWIDNKYGYDEDFEVDQVKKEWLNKELGIKNTYKVVNTYKSFDYNPISER